MERKRMQRAFHRMVTGLQIAQNNNAFMRFLTLTTSKQRVLRRKWNKVERKWEKVERTVKDSFDILRQRIERATYEKDGFWGFKFNRYFCIRTMEGNGVLHVVFWGKYIPQDWLSRNWEEIHGAFKVDIRKVWDKKNKRIGGLVGYLITNYLTEQPIKRMSYGWKWAWLGFCKSWKVVKENYGMLRRWRLPYMPGAKVTSHDRVKDCSWEAWWSFLYGDRATHRERKIEQWIIKDEWNAEDTIKRLMKKWHIKEKKTVYGQPKKRLVWLYQSTLFGFNHGFAV